MAESTQAEVCDAALAERGPCRMHPARHVPSSQIRLALMYLT